MFGFDPRRLIEAWAFRVVLCAGIGAFALVSGLSSGHPRLALGLGGAVLGFPWLCISVTFLSQFNKTIELDRDTGEWTFRNFAFAQNLLEVFPKRHVTITSGEIFEAFRHTDMNDAQVLHMSTSRGIVRVTKYIQPFDELVDLATEAAESTPINLKQRRPISSRDFQRWFMIIVIPLVIAALIIVLVVFP